jgi:PPOX class probable F420-dependent enzyme
VPTIPESHSDLLNAKLATLATVGPDGRPQLSTVWFHASGNDIGISLNTARQKTKNLTANRAMTLHIQDPEHPTRYLEIRGDASVQPDPSYEFADTVGTKYGANLRAMDRPGEQRVHVRIDPVRVNAIDLAR